MADCAGGPWPEKARTAALALSGEKDDDTPASLGGTLLGDIRSVFAEAGTDRLSSATLCEKLNAMEERPWAEIHHGKGISPNVLARLLAPYGISSRKIRPSGDPKTKQGYCGDDFADAWQRYLPPAAVSPVSKWNTGTKPVNIGDNGVFKVEHEKACSTLENATLANSDGPCSIVPLQKPPEPGKEEKDPELVLL